MKVLIKAEFQKIWTSKKFLTSLAVLLAVNIVFLWLLNGYGRSEIKPSAYRQMSIDLSGLSESEKGEFLQELYDRFQAFQVIETVQLREAELGHRLDRMREEHSELFRQYSQEYQNGVDLRYTGSIQSEFSFIAEIKREYEQVSGYQKINDNIQQQAQRLSQISIFQLDETGYDRENILKTAQAYRKLNAIEISYLPQKGLETAINFQLTDWLMMGSIFFLAAAVIHEEKEKGLLGLVASTPCGRSLTGLLKLLSIAGSLIIVMLLFYSTNLLYCALTFGLSGLTSSIQSVPFLMYSSLKVNILQYLALLFAAKWVALLVIGIIVLFAALLFRRSWAGYLTAVQILVSGYLARRFIPAVSRWALVKYVNCISLLNTNELLGIYYNLMLQDIPIRVFGVNLR